MTIAEADHLQSGCFYVLEEEPSHSLLVKWSSLVTTDRYIVFTYRAINLFDRQGHFYRSLGNMGPSHDLFSIDMQHEH